jgi:hypothetical protein
MKTKEAALKLILLGVHKHRKEDIRKNKPVPYFFPGNLALLCVVNQ